MSDRLPPSAPGRPRVGPVSAPTAPDVTAPRNAVVEALTAPPLARRRRPGGLGRGRRPPGVRRQPPRPGPAARRRCPRGARRAWTRSPARTRWPSCRTSARWPTPSPRSRPATPTRTPRSGSCRCSPTRAQPGPRDRAHPAAPVPRGGRPRRASTARSTSSSPGRRWCSAGPGSRRLGLVDDHARLVDVGPTLATLAGVPEAAPARRRRRSAGRAPLTTYLGGGGPPGAGWSASSGTAATAATCCTWPRPGSCPACARLIDAGLGAARRRGGRVPQHHPDQPHLDPHRARAGAARGDGQRVLRPGHRRARRAQRRVDLAPQRRVAATRRCARSSRWSTTSSRRGGAPRTASVNEAIDRGADYSTMQLIRASGAAGGAGSLDDLLPDPESSPFLRRSGVPGGPLLPLGRAGRRRRPRADAPAVGGPGHRAPLTWWANVVTDAGHHGGGPRSEMARDSLRRADARLGAFLDHLDGLGVTG